MNSEAKIRFFGALQIGGGLLTVVFFAGVTILLAMIVSQPARFDLRIPESEESRLLVIFATLATATLFGASVAANGAWQLFFGRRNLFLSRVALFLIVPVVAGAAVSFGAQTNYRY
jgi:hypothetical protein